MNQGRNLLRAAGLLLVVAGLAAAQTYTFATVPAGGGLSGAAGATVGWGYQIVNQSPTQWLVINTLNAGIFTNGTPDGSIFDFPIVPPSTTVTIPYNAVTPSGLYAFTWNAGTATGTGNSGFFVVTADWWNGNPLGAGVLVGPAATLTAPYSVSVPAATTGIPTLSEWGLLLLGMALAAASFFFLRRAPQRG